MKALIWKELREHRLLIIAALVLISLAEIAFLVFASGHRDSHLYFYVGFRYILPVLFAFGASSSVFSGEFVRRTRYFLLSKPYNISGIFIIKFLTGLFVAIFATTVSVSVFELNKYALIELGEMSLWLSVILCCFTYSATLLCSLLTRQTLPSIFLTPVLLIAECLLLSPLIVFCFFFFRIQNSIAVSLGILALFNFFSGLTIWRKNISKDIRANCKTQNRCR
jgi:hypothetical protein